MMPRPAIALLSVNLRRPAILHYAILDGCLPDFAGSSGYPPTAILSINPGIDVVGHCDRLGLAT